MLSKDRHPQAPPILWRTVRQISRGLLTSAAPRLGTGSGTAARCWALANSCFLLAAIRAEGLESLRATRLLAGLGQRRWELCSHKRYGLL